MGGEEDVVEVGEGGVFEGLVMEDVEGGAGDLAGADTVGEGLVDDELAAGAVDDADALLHDGDGLLVDEAFGLGGEADVEREVVGFGEDLFDGDEGDVVFAGDDRGDEGVVADERHAEGAGAAGDFEADAAEADDAEGLAAELGALEGLLVPGAGVHGAVGGGILRPMAIMRPRVSSATATALAPGVFMTTMPWRVAASVSMLSTPTPARPTTRSLGAWSRRAASTWTAERTTRASASASSALRSLILSAVTTCQPGSCWRTARVEGETFSARTIFMGCGLSLPVSGGAAERGYPPSSPGFAKVSVLLYLAFVRTVKSCIQELYG